MLRLFKYEMSNYFANMGKIHTYNLLTNQLINQSTNQPINYIGIFKGFIIINLSPDCQAKGAKNR